MKTYRGYRVKTEWETYEPKFSVDGKDFERLMLQKSLEIRNHSPTGFEFGYGGSGPHQLTLALLMDATGDSDLAERFYHDFLVEHVCCWDREETSEGWAITDDFIKEWVKTKQNGQN
jgi:hypothetical protein